MTLRRVGGDGGVVASTAVGAGGGGGSVAAAGGRWWRGRVLLVVLVGVAVVAVGVGGWLWWTRPLTRSAPLPAGVEKGDVISLDGGGIMPPRTRAGTLMAGGMRSQRHEWVGSVRWVLRGGAEEVYEMRLGESVHIDGLGTVTLLEVNPSPLIPEFPGFEKCGGYIYRVNINFDPGVSLCGEGDSCRR